MLQGKSLGGAEAGLAGGTDKLRDASALLTEDATKLEVGRDELAAIIRHFPPLCNSSSCAGFPGIQEDGGQVPGAGHLLW